MVNFHRYSRFDPSLTLTRIELIRKVSEQSHLSEREARSFVKEFFDGIFDALERGEAVKLSGFGSFQLRRKTQRPGRNPVTSIETIISARCVVTFQASQQLRSASSDSINDY